MDSGGAGRGGGDRPSAVRIGPDGIPATVELVEHLGDAAVLDLLSPGARSGPGSATARMPSEGERVSVTARPEDIHLFDAATRKRL